MRNNTKKGFTLVELLVVIAILAILATVSVVGYTAYIEGSAIKADENMVSQLNHFLDAYKVGYSDSITAENIHDVTRDILAEGGVKTLEAQSEEYGYNFYFDLQKGEYVLLHDDVAINRTGAQQLMKAILGHTSAAGEESTYPVKPENSFTDGNRYFLVSTGGELGELMNKIYGFDGNLDDLKDIYNEDIPKALSATGISIGDDIKAGMSSFVFITDDGIFVIDIKDEHTYPIANFTEGASISLNSTKTDIAGNKDFASESNPLFTAYRDFTIEIPSESVENILGGTFAIATENGATVTIKLTGTVDVENLTVDANFASENVVVNINGTKYQVTEDKVVDRETGDALLEDLKSSNPMQYFDIMIRDNDDYKVHTLINGNHEVVNNGYIAWNKGEFRLQVNPGEIVKVNSENPVTSTEVVWELVDDCGGIFSIDAKTGVVTYNPADVESPDTNEYLVVKATAVVNKDGYRNNDAGENYSTTLKIELVKIVDATITLDKGASTDANGYTSGDSITLIDEGTGKTYAFLAKDIKYNIDETVVYENIILDAVVTFEYDCNHVCDKADCCNHEIHNGECCIHEHTDACYEGKCDHIAGGTHGGANSACLTNCPHKDGQHDPECFEGTDCVHASGNHGITDGTDKSGCAWKCSHICSVQTGCYPEKCEHELSDDHLNNCNACPHENDQHDASCFSDSTCTHKGENAKHDDSCASCGHTVGDTELIWYEKPNDYVQTYYFKCPSCTDKTLNLNTDGVAGNDVHACYRYSINIMGKSWSTWGSCKTFKGTNKCAHINADPSSDDLGKVTAHSDSCYTNCSHATHDPSNPDHAACLACPHLGTNATHDSSCFKECTHIATEHNNPSGTCLKDPVCQHEHKAELGCFDPNCQDKDGNTVHTHGDACVTTCTHATEHDPSCYDCTGKHEHKDETCVNTEKCSHSDLNPNHDGEFCGHQCQSPDNTEGCCNHVKLTVDGNKIITADDCTGRIVNVKVGNLELTGYEINVRICDTSKFVMQVPFTAPSNVYLGNMNEVYLKDLFNVREGKAIPEGAEVRIFNGVFANDDYFSTEGKALLYKTGAEGVTSDMFSVSENVIALTDATWNSLKVSFKNVSGNQPITIAVFLNGVRISENLVVNVVDAYNVTNYNETEDNYSLNFHIDKTYENTNKDKTHPVRSSLVFLDNITMSGSEYDNYFVMESGTTLYGNCYTFDISAGLFNGREGIIRLSSANIQDLRIVGRVYTSFAPTVMMAAGTSAVHATGTSRIENCYITNTRSPIRVSGNVTVKNSILFGGRYANIDVISGTLTIEGTVTTIQQPIVAKDYLDRDTTVIGLGISAWFIDGTKTVNIADGAELIQYNFLNENLTEDLPTVEYSNKPVIDLSAPFEDLFNYDASNPNDQDFSDYQFTAANGDVYLHSGIVATDKYYIAYKPVKNDDGTITITIPTGNADTTKTVKFVVEYNNGKYAEVSGGVDDTTLNDGAMHVSTTAESATVTLKLLDGQTFSKYDFGVNHIQITTGDKDAEGNDIYVDHYKAVMANGFGYSNVTYEYTGGLQVDLDELETMIANKIVLHDNGIHCRNISIEIYTPDSAQKDIFGKTYQDRLEEYVLMTTEGNAYYQYYRDGNAGSFFNKYGQLNLLLPELDAE